MRKDDTQRRRPARPAYQGPGSAILRLDAAQLASLDTAPPPENAI
ncbi:hypothetical protein [Streptomyces sp. NPDC058299]